MKINKKFIYIFIFIFGFLFHLNGVKAEITCTYEMLPVNYYKTTTGSYVPHYISNNGSAGTYTTKSIVSISANSKKDYTLTRVVGMNGSANKTFKDNNFADKISSKNNCPAYVNATLSGADYKIKEIDSSTFLSKQDEFMREEKQIYPMYLTKQNNKTITKYATFSANHALDVWNSIISNSTNEANAQNYQTAAKAYYDEIKKDDSLWNAMTTRGTSWTTFSDFALGDNTTEKQLNQESTDYTAANRNYCYFYCSDYKCASTPEGTAKDACITSCNDALMTTCTNAAKKAEENCRNVKSTASKDQCIKTQLVENGVEADYVELRTNKMTEMQNEIIKLKKSVEIINQNKINIEVGKDPYKVTCDDVKILHQLWIIIIIIAPVLVIVFGTLDFGRAVIASDEEKIKKAWKKFPKRLLAVVILILIPLLINLILSLTTNTTANDTSLMKCIIKGGE